MITFVNKILKKSFKPLAFFVILFALFVVVPNYVDAARDNMGYGHFQCSRHGGSSNCGTISDNFPQNRGDYTSARIEYELTGHRHGGSQMDTSICLLGSNGEGMCQAFSCRGGTCGFEYGGEHPWNTLQTSILTLTSNSPGGSNFYITRSASVEDAEVRVGASGFAEYPDAPPPPPTPTVPPPPPSLPGAFNLNPASCSGGGSINISWGASSNATSYRVERKTWTTGSWGTLATVGGTSYSDTGVSLGVTYYYRIYAINGAGQTRSNPNDDNAIGAACPVPGVAGVCGTANRTYPAGSTSYGSDTYCAAGSPNATPAFPGSGSTVNWICLGSGAPNSPQCAATLQAGSPPPPPPPSNPAVGYLEQANCNVISGWAADFDNWNTSIEAHVYRDGPAGTGVGVIALNANQPRPDVNTVLGQSGSNLHGFSIATPASLKDGLNHSIWVHAIDIGNTGPNNVVSNSGLVLNCPPPATTPTLSSVTINSPTVIPNNTNPYTITVVGNDSGGGNKINYLLSLINIMGSNAGSYRGYIQWFHNSSDPNTYITQKDKRYCTGGGVAAIMQTNPNFDIYGHNYLRLDSCSSSISGNSRTATFNVRFDPSYTSPLLNNDIAGYVVNTDNNTSGWVNSDINFAVASTPTSNATISSSSVNPNGTTPYTITVNGTDSGGASNITHLYALINHQGSNALTYRGYLAWYGPSNAFVGEQDNRLCTGFGGYAAMYSIAPNNVYGHQYMRLDACNVTIFGNTKTITYTVRFDPLFTTPLTNNDISSYTQNMFGLTPGWTNNDVNFSLLTISPPTAPTIAGVATGFVGTSYPYTFTSTDPQGQQIRYGIDWSEPSDGVADEWLPGGVAYVNSGAPRTTNHTWGTVGAKTFRALAQNTSGLNSAWTSKLMTLAAAPVSGVCGTANQSYPNNVTSYGSDTYCALGNPSATPAFPAAGSSVNWTCLGVSGGLNSPQCTASRAATTFLLTVSANPGPGGDVRSADTLINCGPTCSHNYNSGATVTLIAVPASSYWMFTGWNGGGCSGTGNCVINVTGNTVVNATFVPRPFRLEEF